MEHLLSKVRDAIDGGIGSHSTGEALAAALVLNRPDWLTKLGYTIAEAIDRVGPEWVALIPAAAQMVAQTDEVLANAAQAARDESTLESVSRPDGGVAVDAKLVTYSNAPGYRDCDFVFDIERTGQSAKHRLSLRVNPEDGESIARHLIGVHRVAWDDTGPLDLKPGEKRPRWID